MSGMYEVNQIAAASLGADPVTTEAIATAFGLLHVLQVYTSAMMAVAVWDWLVCLQVEWEVIWKSRWTSIKCLYLWTRYYGLITYALCLWLFNANFTVGQCKTLHFLIAATCMWVTLGSEAILAMRTHAFLGRKRWTAILLSAMLLGETAFLLFVSISGVHQTILPVVTRGPCTASDAPGKHIVSGFWLAPVAFDLFCTFLTLWKLTTMHARGSHLVKIFVTEGLIYFIAVAAVNILNAIFMFQSNVNIQNINSFLALILSQVLCCRLVLNLRARGRAGAVHTSEGPIGTSNTKGTMPVFAHPGGTRGPVETGSDTVNIPLERFNRPYDELSYEHEQGVKVHVSVERDVESH
ncbi:uncharacterized protein TRAVEDRAFT_27535 [Trametes versicolor FP-101664 SS1]|uniref:uncharacterized protein n=1 Tax=Trametes versicolor (strain FP-101664) TaxID=717944 RepID=UPI00046235E2|nr:uncharacterized protein TRAVEDRAFT_27535 [Trametes versicolor FP-101664 SS1]EIW62193.1 hypothetical protein TRAVEDRAFT_27535 [Trametes versicolor FP-101664 SS1]